MLACMITPLVETHGRIMVTDERVYFQAFNNVTTQPVHKYASHEYK